MSKKLFFIGVIFTLLAAAAATPFSVRAEDDPPPNPEPVTPPWITGINPNVSLSTEESGELSPAGVADLAAGVEVPLLAAPPDYVDLVPQESVDPSLSMYPLAVPQRYQDPLDNTCGAAALGMALEFLSLNGEGGAPSQAALVAGLKNRGLLYKTGTGVEELAFLARHHGYQGTSAFHDWTLAQLKDQLENGKPVVVSLGSNGDKQPGHFVTLTGISADGKWVSYNDPILGKQIVTADEFQTLWDMQGNSGLVARKEPLSAVDDPMLPWMGLLGAMSVLTVLAKYYPQSGKFKSLLSAIQGILGDPRRKGLGGKLEPVYEWKQVQDGTKMVQDTSKKIPEHGTRWVQKGVKTVKDYSRKIYEYSTRWVQKGVKTVKDYSRKIYEYGTRMVQKGWKTVKNYGKKIYEYGTRWVKKGLKKVTSWVKSIWGWFKKTKWVPKVVKEKFVKGWHYATKKVPNMVKETFVKGWHYATKTVPNMIKETFVKGWHYATKTVPKMVKETFVKGWHYATKVVPNYVRKKVQVGWKEVQDTMADKKDLLNDPVPDEGYGGGHAPHNISLPAPDVEVPVLEDVPGLFQDPLGWLQTTLINAGRQNEIIKNNILGIANLWHNYDDRINQPLVDGASAWPGIIDNTVTILEQKVVQPTMNTVFNPTWWKEEVIAPAAANVAEGLDRAVIGAQGLLNLGAYALNRASQGAQNLINLGVYSLDRASQGAQALAGSVDPIPAILRDSKPVERQPVANPANVTMLRGYTEDELKQILQQQPDGDTCAVTSAAMAINMLYGTDISAEATAKYLHEYPFHLFKLPWFGPPPTYQEQALNYLFNSSGSPFSAEFTQDGNHGDLINNLNDGRITIVNTSHGSDFFPLPPYNGVGHALVLVGFDANTDEYLLLDPGIQGDISRVNRADFTDAWKNRPNPFIPSGTMITIEP